MITTTHAALQAGVLPAHLRCEHEGNPVGVGRPRPVLMWEVRSADPSARSLSQRAYRILAASSPEGLAKDSGDLWDSGKVVSDETLGIRYGGAPLKSLQQVWWKVKLWDQNGNESPWSEPAHWTMALQPADWKARWITRDWNGSEWTAKNIMHDPKLEIVTLTFAHHLLPSPMFRKEFTVRKSIRRALLSATAAGCYQAHINGKRIGDLAIEPGWTFSRKHYHKEPGWVLAATRDVTGMLRTGENAIGFYLGDGWHRDRYCMSPKNQRDRSNGEPSGLRAQLDIEYQDGTRETVATGADWQLFTDGPIRHTSMLDGSAYDARKVQAGWSEPGFKGEGWVPAIETSAFDRLALVPYVGGPVTVMAEIKPGAITEPKPGVYVVDFGQQLAGGCRVTLDGPAGTTVRIRHGQALMADGTLSTHNMGGARHNSDDYTLDGSGPRTFEPPFTYRGFRYAQIEGLVSRNHLKEICALLLSDRARRVGHFESSDPRLNRLWENCYWTIASVCKSVIVDCTGRDERRGWMFDGVGNLHAHAYHLEIPNLVQKILRDMRYEQSAEGMFDYVVPWGGMTTNYSAGWSDSGVTAPANLLAYFGDDRDFEEHFAAMKRFSRFVASKFQDYIVTKEEGPFWGDWLSFSMTDARPKGDREPVARHPSREVFGTVWWYWTTRKLEGIARYLGKETEAAELASQAERIRTAFNDRLVDDSGVVGGLGPAAVCDMRGRPLADGADNKLRVGGQADAGMALHAGLIADDRKDAVVKHLLRCIEEYNGHLSTGIHGTTRLLWALSENGRHSQAWKLAMQPTFPSYGYMVDRGATGIWESWEHVPPDETTKMENGGPVKNDANHPGLAWVGEWIFGGIGGIRPDPAHPGFKRLIIKPHTDAGPESVKADYDSVRGRISCHWRRSGGRLEMEVVIPPNTMAEIWLPAAGVERIKESGRPLDATSGVNVLGSAAGWTRAECRSGRYRFESRAGESP